MSPTQGSRCAANPGLSKSSPSGNDAGQCRSTLPRTVFWGSMTTTFPLPMSSLPIGAQVLGCMPSGADTEVRRPGAERVEERKWRVDTEVRPPPTLVLAPYGAVGGWTRIGLLVRVIWLPIGAGVLRRPPSGAYTEVRPPRHPDSDWVRGFLGCGFGGGAGVSRWP